ncbi:MAG: imidazolonepropionase [Coriobacteriia bacterium]|nr:imidazolonepropionase [Coriobacteriia bacterium]MBN2823456.1 imidazolonepropionase [Coriobacteriia bacterium]
MTSTLVTGISELVTCDPTLGDGSPLGIVHKAALVIEDERVAWVGEALHAPATDTQTDLEGRAVIPGFVDSHTHLVFAGERSAEWESRMAGAPYTGGGIATTVAATRAASFEKLRAHTQSLVEQMRAQGTTTIEIKSGYGLDVVHEVLILEVARDFTRETTFLGAHVIPAEYAGDREGYVDLVCGEMLQTCAPFARWIDVFCDTGAFDEAETRRILSAGRGAGLGVRLHGNQLEHGPGVRLAVEFAAASVDHCNHLSDEDVEALAASDVVATLLPGADFSTRAAYANGRRLLDAGVTVAIATDCNPGSAYITSMPLCIALAVREMGLTPAEALYAATRGGARALHREDVGRLSVGAYADLAALDAPSYLHLAYRPGSQLVSQSWRRGTPG